MYHYQRRPLKMLLLSVSIGLTQNYRHALVPYSLNVRHNSLKLLNFDIFEIMWDTFVFCSVSTLTFYFLNFLHGHPRAFKNLRNTSCFRSHI